MLIENLKDYDLVELVKDDEMARLMAKYVLKICVKFQHCSFWNIMQCISFVKFYIYIYESYVIIRSMCSHFKTWIQ
jgi:CRISPR/Cas system CMR-associated protein Cmr1 (group 7 of RAMP superfamily)